MGSSGFEPPTLRLSGARSNHLSYEPVSLYVGGDEGIRTLDPLLAGQVLSQLSYTPVPLYFRSPGLFPLLGSLFSLRFSSSFRAMKTEQQASVPDSVLLLFFCRDSSFLYLDFRIIYRSNDSCLLRKEVIQPHLPIRLPCYDLTPIIEPTFGCSLLAVRIQTSGLPDFHGLTGGVYKARERIHRGMLIRDY